MCVFVVSLVLYKTIFISHSSSLRLFLHKSSQSACNISLCVFGELMIINTLKNQSISIIMLHAFVRTKIQNHFLFFFSFCSEDAQFFSSSHNSSSFIFSLVTSLSYFWTFKYLYSKNAFHFRFFFFSQF